jgi:hypothetical protein
LPKRSVTAAEKWRLILGAVVRVFAQREGDEDVAGADRAVVELVASGLAPEKAAATA